MIPAAQATVGVADCGVVVIPVPVIATSSSALAHASAVRAFADAG